MELKYKPKFCPGSIVCLKDTFGHNPAEEAILIGTVNSVIVFHKPRIFIRDSKPGDIYYNISGMANLVKEDKIELYLDALKGE